MPAPIAFFVYRRPRHAQLVIDALAANDLAPETDLFIFADGPKTSDDAGSVEDTRQVLRNLAGFKTVTLLERPTNIGLSRNIISGVSEVLRSHESVIVVEDDLVTSQHFLRFLNAGLDVYRKIPSVGSICGYSYLSTKFRPETFFIRGGDCWGWATWHDRWASFEQNGATLLAELKKRKLTYAFDLDGTMPATKMLRDQIAECNDSWAIRWHAHCFLRGLMCLYPHQSLVQNIGFDATGTHCSQENTYDVTLAEKSIDVKPQTVEESADGRASFKAFYQHSYPRISLARRVARRIRRAITSS